MDAVKIVESVHCLVISGRDRRLRLQAEYCINILLLLDIGQASPVVRESVFGNTNIGGYPSESQYHSFLTGGSVQEEFPFGADDVTGEVDPKTPKARAKAVMLVERILTGL